MSRSVQFERFLSLSAALTGFDRVSLLGTGLANFYAELVRSEVGAGELDGLLAAYASIAPGAGSDEQLRSVVLDDPSFGPIARKIVVLWYCGTWAPLADASAARVASAEAYRQGLQWQTAGAHPMGAHQQGYGAWATAPVLA